jgi:hypothetical protein
VFPSVRRSGSVRALFLSLLTLSLASLVTSAQAQTAPQLLPYTARLLAGGGSTKTGSGSTGSVCAGATGVAPSGNISTDVYADGCLATEVPVVELNAGKFGPHAVLPDTKGTVYFGDDNFYLVRRIDPTTGVVTLIGGGVGVGNLTTPKNPASGATCGNALLTDTAHTAAGGGDVLGDGCLGTEVAFGSVTGLAFSPTTGDLYIGDEFYHNIRKMSVTNGGVAGVVITASGSNYSSAPTVTFSAPASGVTATGIATVSGGSITSITITNPGSGYSASAMPTVTFSGSGTGAAGTAVYTGVMSLVVGGNNGISTSADGYISATPGSSSPTCNATDSTQPCVLDQPWGFTVDKSGNVIIADEFYNAIEVFNTNASGSTTVAGQTIPAQTLVRIAGSRNATGSTSGGQPCLSGVNSTTTATGTGPSGCNFGNYTTGVPAAMTLLDAPYDVALDSSGNIYAANEFNNAAFQIGNSTGLLTHFAGVYPESSTGKIQPQTQRAPAGTFAMGTAFKIALDTTNNVYLPDALAGYVWRVDATTNSQYVIGGGGTATVAGNPCATSGIGANFTATDTYGDGCPGLLASFSKSGTSFASTGVWGVSPDTYGDLFITDEGNGLVRELASGTQFGDTGASATDYIAVHFAAGDTPITASSTGAPFTATPINLFKVGTPTCTTNSDTTTDCIVPVTASPSTAGPYSGTFTVVSNKVSTLTNFPLNGNFAQNPNTRLALSFVDTKLSCTTAQTTFLSGDTIAITGTLILAGPVPTGTITFFATVAGGAPMQIGTPQAVVNMGTASAPLYGATVNFPSTMASSYTVTANYTSNGGYYNPSNASGLFTTATPSFTLSAATNTATTQTVTAGQTALFSFTSNPTVYTGTITYAITGLPANTSYTLSPTSIATTGCSQASTIALSILTTANNPTTIPAGLMSGRGPWMLLSVAVAFGLALLLGLRLRGSRFGQMMIALLLLAATSGLVACNGTHVNAPPATPTSTAANPYKIVVTATGSAGGTASTTFSLIVQ